MHGPEGSVKCLIIGAPENTPALTLEFLSPLPVFLYLGPAVVRGVIDFNDKFVLEESEIREVPQPAEEEQGVLSPVDGPECSDCGLQRVLGGCPAV
jgi:hypothetical protein